MQKYQLVNVDLSRKNAGGKAPSDVSLFAEECGYKRIELQVRTTNSFIARIFYNIKLIINILKLPRLSKGDFLLLQFPFYFKTFVNSIFLLKLKRMKANGVYIIVLLHDVNELRFDNAKNRKNLDSINRIGNYFIVHNQNMINYLKTRNFSDEVLINLKIFDYKLDKRILSNKSFSRNIIIAGSLDEKKSLYLSKLKELQSIDFELYGPNYNPQKMDAPNIFYKGCVSPDELPSKFDNGFGLIWDGNSIDCCSGGTGEYLKYNNPHKMSLYIASGIPVVIWSKAAQASFVLEHGIGIVIDSLNDLPKKLAEISESDYNNFSKAVNVFSEKIQNGYFIKSALQKCEECIEKL